MTRTNQRRVGVAVTTLAACTLLASPVLAKTKVKPKPKPTTAAVTSTTVKKK